MRQALRQHHLHDVAVKDVALGALDGGDESAFGKLGHRRRRRHRHLRRHRHRLPQCGEQYRQLAPCRSIGFRLARIGIDHQVEFARQVVDHRQSIGQQQHHVGRAEHIRLRRRGEPWFDVAHGVVAEVADEAAGESRQVRDRRCVEAGVNGADPIERIRLLALREQRVATVFAAYPPPDLEAHLGRQPDERVAPETLAALHRFEQIRVGKVAELEVDRQRGVEVGKGFEHHRYPVEPLLRELPELRFVHDHSKHYDRLREQRIGGKLAHAPRDCQWAPAAPRTGRETDRIPVLEGVRDHDDGLAVRTMFSIDQPTIASAQSRRTTARRADRRGKFAPGNRRRRMHRKRSKHRMY